MILSVNQRRQIKKKNESSKYLALSLVLVFCVLKPTISTMYKKLKQIWELFFYSFCQFYSYELKKKDSSWKSFCRVISTIKCAGGNGMPFIIEITRILHKVFIYINPYIIPKHFLLSIKDLCQVTLRTLLVTCNSVLNDSLSGRRWQNWFPNQAFFLARRVSGQPSELKLKIKDLSKDGWTFL